MFWALSQASPESPCLLLTATYMEVGKPSKRLRIGSGTGSRLGVRNLGSRRTSGWKSPSSFVDANPENAKNFCIVLRSGGISAIFGCHVRRATVDWIPWILERALNSLRMDHADILLLPVWNKELGRCLSVRGQTCFFVRDPKCSGGLRGCYVLLRRESMRTPGPCKSPQRFESLGA